MQAAAPCLGDYTLTCLLTFSRLGGLAIGSDPRPALLLATLGPNQR